MDTVFLALRVLLSLAVVLGVLWMLHRRLTRNGRLSPRAAKPVTVVTRQNIAPKASVVVMDVDGERFLLGVTEQSVTVLKSGGALQGGVPQGGALQGAAAQRAAPEFETAHSAVPIIPRVRHRVNAAPSSAVRTVSTGSRAANAQDASTHANTRRNGSAAFARVLSEAQQPASVRAGSTRADGTLADSTVPDSAVPASARLQKRASALEGSILSPATWKSAADALKRAR